MFGFSVCTWRHPFIDFRGILPLFGRECQRHDGNEKGPTCWLTLDFLEAASGFEPLNKGFAE
jgi:hypothetical protein